MTTTGRVRILLCRVSQEPVDTAIEDTLEVQQEIVGGYVQQRHLDNGVHLYCDEDKHGPFNRHVPGKALDVAALSPDFVQVEHGLVVPAPGTVGVHDLYGDFFLARLGGGRLASLTDEDIATWSAILRLNPAQRPRGGSR